MARKRNIPASPQWRGRSISREPRPHGGSGGDFRAKISELRSNRSTKRRLTARERLSSCALITDAAFVLAALCGVPASRPEESLHRPRLSRAPISGKPDRETRTMQREIALLPNLTTAVSHCPGRISKSARLNPDRFCGIPNSKTPLTEQQERHLPPDLTMVSHRCPGKNRDRHVQFQTAFTAHWIGARVDAGMEVGK